MLAVALQLVDTHPRVRADLGAGERVLTLSSVNASDGLWHEISVRRYGNQVQVYFDQAEGVYFDEVLPVDDFRLLFVNDVQQTYAGAELYYRKWHQEDPIISTVLISSAQPPAHFTLHSQL